MSPVAAHPNRRPGWSAIVLAVLLAVMLVAALVSLSNTNRGIIRVMDLVREPTLDMDLHQVRVEVLA